MSLLRLAAARASPALCAAPVRAFSTTAARLDADSNSTAALFKDAMSARDTQNGSSLARPQPQADDAAARSPHKYARDMLQNMASTADDIDSVRLRGELENMQPRRWQAGDVYAPHDLSGAEAKKARRTKQTANIDAFQHLALDPLKEYKNFAIMSEYMTELGRIKHSKVTGLKPQNQRKVAKAIRRAIGIGLMPSVHIHPELIKPSAPHQF